MLQRILSIGTHAQLSSSETKKIKVLNAINLIRLAAILLYHVVELGLNANPWANLQGHWCFAFLILITFALLHFRHYLLAKLLFILSVFGNIYVFAYALEPGKLMEYYLVIVPTLSLLLFDERWINKCILLISIFLFFVPNYLLGNKEMLDVPITKIVIFVGLYVNFSYMKNLNLKNEALLEEQKNQVLADKAIIESQKKELEEIQQFQNQFFQNVVHEIKTPLTILKGSSAQLFRSIVPSLIEQQENLQEIQNQTGKIQRIVDDVLDLARMNQESFRLTKEVFDLYALTQKVVGSFGSIYQSKNIELQLEVSSPHNFPFYGSSLYMERCLNNLLANAHKFTPKNGTVKVGLTKTTDKEISLSIEDSGIGIGEAELEKIFERFYQSKHPINEAGGSGVGLAFCKEVVLLHDGQIKAGNNPMGGASFEILLPASLQNKTKEESPASLLRTISIVESQPKILLVEDIADMRRYLKKVMRDWQVTEVDNGLEALEELQKETFDLIITDYMMPEMNGHDLIKHIREQKIYTPIIMLSARNEQETKLEILRLGVDDFISKPFDEQELLARIENSIQNQRRKLAFVEEERVEIVPEQEELFQKKLAHFIEENCTAVSFGVPEICEEFALSTSSLYRKVRAYTGLSPKEFITEVRLNKARTIRGKQPKLPLKAVAQEVGYVNYSHFGKLYEKRFGENIA